MTTPSIRRLGHGEEDAFIRLFGERYGTYIETQTRARFDWQYRRHPYRHTIAATEEYGIYGAFMAETLVGCVGLWPAPALIGGRATMVCWLTDLVVRHGQSAVYRASGRTVGEHLIDRVRNDMVIPVAGIGMTPEAHTFWNRYSAAELYPGPFEMVRDLRRVPGGRSSPPDPDIRSRARNFIFERSARCPAPAATSAALQGFLKYELSDKAEYDVPKTRRASAKLRAPSYLRWRYDQHPYHRYQHLIWRDRGTLNAWVIARVAASDYLGKPLDAPILWLVETFLAPDREIADIIGDLSADAMALGCREIRFWTTDMVRVQRAEACGFVRRNDFSEPILTLKPASGSSAATVALDNWDVGRGDSDLDAL